MHSSECHSRFDLWYQMITTPLQQEINVQHHFYWGMLIQDELLLRFGISEIEVVLRSLCHCSESRDAMFVCVQCCVSFVLRACWCTAAVLYCMHVKVLMGPPEILFFLSGSRTSQLQENNPGLCCDTAHCPRRCLLVCVCAVCVPVHVHLCVLAAWYK